MLFIEITSTIKEYLFEFFPKNIKESVLCVSCGQIGMRCGCHGA